MGYLYTTVHIDSWIQSSDMYSGRYQVNEHVIGN